MQNTTSPGENHPPDQHKPMGRLVVFLSLGLMAISASAILIRWSKAPSLAVAFWRISFSILLLAPLWLGKQRWRELRQLRPALRWSLLGSGLCLGVHFWTWISSLQYTSVAASVLLVTTNPIWVGLLSPWLLKESLTTRGWIGIGIAMLGAFCLAFSGESGQASHPQPLWGNTLALFGAFAASGYLMMGRKVRPYLDLWTYASATLWGAWLVLALGVWSQASDPVTLLSHYPLQEWVLFALMALLPQMVGHNSLSWSLRYLRANTIAVLLLLEPVGSTLLAALLLSEVPGWMIWIAGPILLLGVGIVVSEASTPQRKS